MTHTTHGLANTHPTTRRRWHVNIYDMRTGRAYTRIVAAHTAHGAFERATADRDDWTEAEVCLPNGEQIALYDRWDTCGNVVLR